MDLELMRTSVSVVKDGSECRPIIMKNNEGAIIA